MTTDFKVSFGPNGILWEEHHSRPITHPTNPMLDDWESYWVEVPESKVPEEVRWKILASMRSGIVYEADQVREMAKHSQYGEHADIYGLIERLAAQVTEAARLLRNGSPLEDQ